MKKLVIIIMCLLSVLSGCSERDSNPNQKDSQEKLNIYTSIYPLEFIASEIGGDKVAVKNIVPAGTEPHDFEPSLKMTADIEKADLFIYNGANLESWAERTVESANVESLEAAQFVELISIEEDSEKHTDEALEDSHGGKDPHIWLSLKNMDMIAKAVEQKLIELDAKNERYYEENYQNLSKKLLSLNGKYGRELQDKKNNTFLVSHSAFRYLAKEYSLEQISVSGVSPNAEPSPRTLSKLIDLSKEKELEYIYRETLASPKSVEMITEEANLKSSVLHTIESLTPENIENNEDYMSLMEQNLANLKKELLN